MFPVPEDRLRGLREVGDHMGVSLEVDDDRYTGKRMVLTGCTE